MESPYVLELKNITKIYDNGTVADKNISLSFKTGEIHAIVGENGSGKSTLMKVIFGLEMPTEGSIVYKGKEVRFKSPLDTIRSGIGMVHQHFMLVPSFTVLENIVLGDEPTKFAFIQKKKSRENAEALAKQYGFDLHMDTPVSSLGVGMKQKVEILKLLYKGAEVLILDEPTAVLTPQETKQLFENLKKFKEAGKTIIFISHKLNEVKEISDRISVIRKGELITTRNTSEVKLEEISQLMIGRKVEYAYDDLKEDVLNQDNVVEIDGVSYIEKGLTKLKDIHLSLKKGRITGVVGVEGNGQQELVELLFGYKKASQGTIKVEGIDVADKSIKAMRKELKVSYIPEDRMRQGIAGKASVKENLISNIYDDKQYNSLFAMKKKPINSLCDKLIQEYDVVCQDRNSEIVSLSGGNIQKVVVARECFANPQFLIAEQPTRGVDIGSASFIHKKLIEMRNKGKAILLVSADLSEALAVSDDLIVMYEGEIVAYFDHVKNVSEQELGLYMLGIQKMEQSEMQRRRG